MCVKLVSTNNERSRKSLRKEGKGIVKHRVNVKIWFVDQELTHKISLTIGLQDVTEGTIIEKKEKQNKKETKIMSGL